MATLLVLGGSGFFGKSILDFYQRGGLMEWDIDRVISASRSPDKLIKEVPELITSSVDLLQLDVSKPHKLPKADYIIHAAASTDAAAYLNSGEAEKENIISGVKHFCDALNVLPVLPKIFFCSSGAVYGFQESEEGLIESEIFSSIDKLDLTKRLYSQGKREAEEYILLQNKERKFDVKIGRCFAFYGKYLPKNKHFAFGNFLLEAKAGKDITIKSSKKVYRSYMHADDLVKSFFYMMNSTYSILNIGSDKRVELFELAELIAKKYKVKINVNQNRSDKDLYYPNTEKLKGIFQSEMKEIENEI